MKKRLGDYIQEYSVRNKSGEDIPVYSVTNSQGFCRDYFSKEVASKDKTTYKIVPRGCFAYNPSRINVGSVDWQRDEERVIVSPLYNIFSVSPEIDQQYLYYYLKSSATLYRIKEVATGSVRDNLRLSMLYDFMIELPSLDVQRQIVSNLDLLASIIRQRNQQLTKLDELVKARFVEMFGGYEPNAKLSDVASITGGLTKNSNRNKMKLKLPYLRVANVSYAKIDVSEMLEIGLTEDEKAKTLLSYDDLLFVEGNGSPDQIGRVALWKNEITPCVHQNHLIKARFNSHLIVPYFALHYFMSQEGREQIQGKAVSTSGLYTLSVSKISNLLIPTPPLSLQNQFAAFVEEVDKSKLLAELFAQNACILAENRSK